MSDTYWKYVGRYRAEGYTSSGDCCPHCGSYTKKRPPKELRAKDEPSCPSYWHDEGRDD